MDAAYFPVFNVCLHVPSPSPSKFLHSVNGDGHFDGKKPLCPSKRSKVPLAKIVTLTVCVNEAHVILHSDISYFTDASVFCTFVE